MTNEDPSMQVYVMGVLDHEKQEFDMVPYTLHANRLYCERLGANLSMRKYLAVQYVDEEFILCQVTLSDFKLVSKYKSPLHRPEEAGE